MCSKAAFRITVPFFEILGSHQDRFCVAGKTMRFMKEMHESAFLYHWFLRSDISTLFVAILVFTLVWRRRTLALGVSRRRTRVDFLRTPAPLACGRWWEWQIANFGLALVVRFGLRNDGLVKSRWNVPPRRGGDDFECDAYLWDYLVWV
jgi:hypothetical protein